MIFAIAFLSLLPGDRLPDSPLKYTDIAVHVIMYGTLTIVILLERHRQYPITSPRSLIVPVLLVSVYGLSIEILQESFIPGRYGSVSDGIANAFGSAIGAFLAGRRMHSRKRPLE
ncbi:MAG: VanZ family protein [Vicingaceae bacterium]